MRSSLSAGLSETPASYTCNSQQSSFHVICEPITPIRSKDLEGMIALHNYIKTDKKHAFVFLIL